MPPEQRLDEGEEVRWIACPARSMRAYLPLSVRRTFAVALGVLCCMAVARTVMVGVSILGRLVAAGYSPWNVPSLSLIAALVVTVVVLSVLGGKLVHCGVTRKPWLDAKTRYVVTDQRFILERGNQELHVNRSAIVDVVDRDGLYGGRDAYLILDGPQSRAVSAQGAFGPGERARGFRPMMQAISEAQVQKLREELFGQKAG